jgi:molybdenum cofactor guanylyltransferase
MKNQSAIILAGGLSTRMGFDKQLLNVGNVSIMDNLINKLSLIFPEVLISTNKPELYKDSKNILLQDEIGKGPLAGIYSGLKFCKSDYLYVTACDMPFVSNSYINYMKELTLKNNFDVCVVKRNDGYYEPFNAFYNKSALIYIEKAILNNDFAMHRLLDTMNLLIIDKSKVSELNNYDMFFNANYKEDLQIIEKNKDMM